MRAEPLRTALDPFARIRQQIPATHRYTFLDWAATAPLPDYVRAAVDASMERRAWSGELMYDDALARVDGVRGEVASHLGVSADGIAFMKNTGEGLNHVARSLDIKPGSNVVVSPFEFPTNHLPWTLLKGVEVRTPPADDDGVGCTPEAFASVIDDDTAVVATSWVTFNTGYRMDLPAIGKIAHEHGALLVVDGMQGMGALTPPSFRNVDAFACGGHKWLMAPLGVAVLYVRPSLVLGTLPDHLGWFSLADTSDYDHPEAPLADTARRFEVGNLAFDLIEGLGAALRSVPPIDRIEARIRALTDRLFDALEPLGAIATPRDWERRAGIVRFEHPDARRLQADLLAAKVVTSVRTGGLRFAVHAWNTEEDVDRAADRLAQALR